MAACVDARADIPEIHFAAVMLNKQSTNKVGVWMIVNLNRKC